MKGGVGGWKHNKQVLSRCMVVQFIHSAPFVNSIFQTQWADMGVQPGHNLTSIQSTRMAIDRSSYFEVKSYNVHDIHANDRLLQRWKKIGGKRGFQGGGCSKGEVIWVGILKTYYKTNEFVCFFWLAASHIPVSRAIRDLWADCRRPNRRSESRCVSVIRSDDDFLILANWIVIRCYSCCSATGSTRFCRKSRPWRSRHDEPTCWHLFEVWGCCSRWCSSRLQTGKMKEND